MPTVFSIPMNDLRSVERRVPGEIMKTDIFVKVVSRHHDASRMEADVETALGMFREFESRFSRFRPDSELSVLNAGSGMDVSPELFSLLERSAGWFRETGGVFDPSVLPSLEAEGYGSSFGSEGFGAAHIGEGGAQRSRLDEVTLGPGRSVRKPPSLRIDLGGIGKGYIVDRVAEFLARTYEHVFVDAGGDIRTYGVDAGAGYDFWAVDVGDPSGAEDSLATLLLRDRAVATSGTYRRRWTVSGSERHHLIDPKTGHSAETDLAAVTVVAESAEQAEVFSKTLCILGLERGRHYAETNRLPALFVTRDGHTIYTGPMTPYIWKG